MQNMRLLCGVAFGVTLASTALGDTDIALEDVPSPVRATIDRETRQGTLEDIEWEPSAKVPHYDIEYSIDGVEWELEIAEDGRVLRHEQDD